MAEIASAWVSVALSAKGIQGQIQKEVGGPLARAGAEAGSKAGEAYSQSFTSKTRGALEGFSTKALAGSAILGAGLFKAASAASSLEAALGANVQVLGEASASAQDFAKNAVESVGLSERAALEASTRFGQLGKIIGLTGEPLATFSTDLITLAADMAAFADVPIDVAIQDLTAAFQGSTETVSKYGVFLNETALKAAYFEETGQKVTGTLTSQQRIIATNAALWAQTADIQGQAARESGSLARAQDNLKASFENASAQLGAALLPSITSLVNVGTDAIGMFSRFNESTGGLVGQIAAFSAVGLGAVGVVGKMSSVIRGLSSPARAAGVAMAGLAAAYAVYTLALSDTKAADSFNANKVERWVEAIVAGSSALDALRADIEELGKIEVGLAGMPDDLTLSLDELNLTHEDFIALTKLSESAIVDWAKAQKQAGDGSNAAVTVMEGAIQTKKDLAEASELAAARERVMGDAATEAGEAVGWAAEAFDNFGRMAGWATDAFGEFGSMAAKVAPGRLAADMAHYGSTIDAVVEQSRAQIVAYEELKAAAQEYGDVIAGVDWGRTAFEGATTALGSFNSFIFGGLSQVSSMEGAMDGLAESLKEVGTVGAGGLADLNLKTNEGRAAFSALQEVAGAWEPQLADAIANADGNVETLSGSIGGIRGDFIQMATDAGIGAEEAGALATAIGLVPENAQTLIELSGHEEAMIQIGLLQGVIGGLSEEAQREIALRVINGDAVGAIEVVQGELESIPDEHSTTVTTPGAAQSASDLDMVDSTARAMSDAEQVKVDTPGAAASVVALSGVDYAAISMSNAESVEVDTPGASASQNELNQVDSAARGIPESEHVTVSAETATALSRIDGVGSALSRLQNKTVFVDVIQRTGDFFRGLPGDAYGSYHPGGSPELRWVGEAPWDEATLTVGNLPNLAKQLQDPKILRPILSVLPLERGGEGGGPAQPIYVTVQAGNQTIVEMAKGVIHEQRRAVAAGSRY